MLGLLGLVWVRSNQRHDDQHRNEDRAPFPPPSP